MAFLTLTALALLYIRHISRHSVLITLHQFIGQIEVETDGSKLIGEREKEFIFAPGINGGKIKLTNLSDVSQSAHVRLQEKNSEEKLTRQLAPGEIWEIAF